jgi:hypothetical protein
LLGRECFRITADGLHEHQFESFRITGDVAILPSRRPLMAKRSEGSIQSAAPARVISTVRRVGNVAKSGFLR